MRKQQSGVMLLEALIAILIFSLGVLGIVGTQASAVNASRAAKYRTDAGLLANELIGLMWSGDRRGNQLQDNFQGDGATDCTPDPPVTAYCAWRLRVVAALPGAATNATTLPLVTVTPGVAGPPQTSTRVSIRVRWLPPNTTVPHQYLVVFEIV